MLSAESKTLTIREVRADESERWDEFVAAAPNGHILQSWAWGQFKARYGWQPVRLALEDDGRFRAGAQVLLRSQFGVTLAYVPRGPVAMGEDPEAYVRLLQALHRLARSRHSIFLKVEPNEPAGSPVADLLRQEGFFRSSHTVQPRETLFTDLRGGPDAVFARLKKKTRANIRRAERRGVQVRLGDREGDFERFFELMAATGDRAEFPVRSLRYYRSVFEEFHPRNQAELMIAELEGKIIAASMVFAYGREGVAMYGASDSAHWREYPNYIRHWRAMEWCMSKGCERYDLWGVPQHAVEESADDAAADEDRPEGEGGLWGVYRFKRQFGDMPVRYVGAFDYPYIRPLYLLWSHLRRNEEP